MMIAITAAGRDLDSPVDGRFGRARFILFVDTETEKVNVADNASNVNAAQGAGIQAAQDVVDNGAEWVVTGHVGPKAFSALAAAGVKIGIGSSGTCRDTLLRFQRGEFEAAREPDAASHSRRSF